MPFCARLPQLLNSSVDRARLPRLLNSSVDRVQRIMGSAALVLGSILVAALVCFALMASVLIALVQFRFV